MMLLHARGSMRKIVLLVAVTACAGKAPPSTGDNPDAAQSPQDAPASAALKVSGKTMDYFGNVPVPAATVTSDGISPAAMAVSGADATYSIDVQVGSKLFLLAAMATYRETRSAPISVADMSVMQDIYLMSGQDVKNQYTVLGKLPTTGTAFLAAELKKNNGTPLEGIPLANVTLLNAQNQPVPGIVGPYFFGTAGSIDPALATATAYGTPLRSRVAILDIPPGTYTLQVTYPNGQGGNAVNTTQVSVSANGATLAVSGGTGGMMGGGGTTNPTFATDIYPRLQRAALGGLGCANCHTATGTASVLPYDDPAATVLTKMQAITGVINLATPASSLFLTNPLYELPPAVQNHPNATFLDVNDPDYKLFLLWITQGAKP